jgi:hypothetical protein
MTALGGYAFNNRISPTAAWEKGAARCGTKYREPGAPAVEFAGCPMLAPFARAGPWGSVYATTEILNCAVSRSTGTGSLAFFRPSADGVLSHNSCVLYVFAFRHKSREWWDFDLVAAAFVRLE